MARPIHLFLFRSASFQLINTCVWQHSANPRSPAELAKFPVVLAGGRSHLSWVRGPVRPWKTVSMSSCDQNSKSCILAKKMFEYVWTVLLADCWFWTNQVKIKSPATLPNVWYWRNMVCSSHRTTVTVIIHVLFPASNMRTFQGSSLMVMTDYEYLEWPCYSYRVTGWECRGSNFNG